MKTSDIFGILGVTLIVLFMLWCVGSSVIATREYDKKHPVATVEVETSKFTHLGKARGADVYFFKYADHDCFMVSVGNGVSVHCPK